MAMAAAPYLHARLSTIDATLSPAAAEPSPEKTSREASSGPQAEACRGAGEGAEGEGPRRGREALPLVPRRGVRAIAAALNDRGVRTARGGA
jgi:hypothetical protein